MYTELQYIGHFRDEALIPKLEAELSKHGILHEIRTTSQEIDFRLPAEVIAQQGDPQLGDGKHYLFAERTRFAEALKIYQVILGIGAPSAPNEADQEWIKVSQMPVGPVGKFSIILSVALFICYRIESLRPYVELLFFGSPRSGLFEESLAQGQVWRLITPIFLHFSFLHILFNAMWMRELSKILEDYYSPKKFLFIFLFLALGSNVAQYLMKGPMFGGLSGVVYGLLGVLWVKKSLDEDFPFMLPKRDIYLMVGWFFLCLTGILGNIANTAHGVGLALGMLVSLIEVRTKVSAKATLFKWASAIFGILFLTALAEVAWSVVTKVPLFYMRFS